MLQHGRVRPAALGFRSQGKGFTLVEMMVVMAIIGVIIGVGAAGMKGLTTAKGVPSGVGIADSLFAEARSLAMGSGHKTRLAFVSDSQLRGKDEEKYLRYMVVFENQSEDPEVENWEPTGRGLSLPGKTFFDKRVSVVSGTATMEFPGLGNSRCHYYEFNSQGIVTNRGGGNDASKMISCVISSGVAVPSVEQIIDENLEDRSGFVVWQNGRRTVYRDSSQLPK